MPELDFFCPKCGKKREPSWACLITNYSIQRLDLPYFLCGDCRLMHIDKRLLRNIVSHWRKNSKYAQTFPFKRIYAEVAEYMEEVIRTMEKIGYRQKRVRKTSQKHKKEEMYV